MLPPATVPVAYTVDTCVLAPTTPARAPPRAEAVMLTSAKPRLRMLASCVLPNRPWYSADGRLIVSPISVLPRPSKVPVKGVLLSPTGVKPAPLFQLATWPMFSDEPST